MVMSSLYNGRMKQKLDLGALASEVQKMSVRSELYKVLKRELSARGWWKNRARGKADPNRFK